MRARYLVVACILLLTLCLLGCGSAAERPFITSSLYGDGTTLSISLPFEVDTKITWEPVPPELQDFTTTVQRYETTEDDVALTVRNLTLTTDIDMSTLSDSDRAEVLRETANGDYEDIRTNKAFTGMRISKNESIALGNAVAQKAIQTIRLR